MKTVGSYEAKTHLPRLLEEVLKTGETIAIAKHGVPIAHLTPIPSSQRADLSSVIGQAMGATLALGCCYGISAYDAAYLELAMREGLPIATIDGGLSAIASQAGVEIYLSVRE